MGGAGYFDDNESLRNNVLEVIDSLGGSQTARRSTPAPAPVAATKRSPLRAAGPDDGASVSPPIDFLDVEANIASSLDDAPGLPPAEDNIDTFFFDSAIADDVIVATSPRGKHKHRDGKVPAGPVTQPPASVAGGAGKAGRVRPAPQELR